MPEAIPDVPLSRRSPTWPSAASEVVGVVGDPVRHSLSPLLHNAAFDALGLDWVSVAFPVVAGALPAALEGMRALGVRGLSVTMPHKEVAAATVDACSALAQRLASVNCITVHGDQLVGDSTDGPGLMAALEMRLGFQPRGSSCLVIGAGGAARAVVAALADAGADQVVVVNRSPERAAIAAALAGEAGRVGSSSDGSGADLVVNAIPVGMGGSAGGTAPYPVDLHGLHAGQLVVDLVYRPARTPLLEAAAAQGATVANGLGMLVHQAALAVETWTGRQVPVDVMWAAAAEAGGAPS
jgi:shikimate dehydrogenase